MKKYTLIEKTITGKPIRARHYETKKEAFERVAFLVSLGYQVEVMAYSVWVNDCDVEVGE